MTLGQVVKYLPVVVARQFLNRAEESSSQLSPVGGQAVIEGVMMRSRKGVATAVRREDGRILVKLKPYLALAQRFRFWRLPLLRGVAALWESLVIGTATLNWSAEIASQEEAEEERERTWKDRLLSTAVLIFSLALGLGFFVYLPYLLSELIQKESNPLVFHLIAGSLRIVLLLAYMWGISFSKEIRRLFMYHGAEHKSIFTYEKGEALTPENAAAQTRFHPRCGTSFILIVALLTMVAFMFIDLGIISLVGNYKSILQRFLVHIPFIPLVAGFSFEMLKLSDCHREGFWGRQVVKPGLWLQRITTREPDKGMLEVALVSLQSSLTQEVDPEVAELYRGK